MGKNATIAVSDQYASEISKPVDQLKESIKGIDIALIYKMIIVDISINYFTNNIDRNFVDKMQIFNMIHISGPYQTTVHLC